LPLGPKGFTIFQKLISLSKYISQATNTMGLFDRKSTQPSKSGLIEVGAVWNRTSKVSLKPYQALSFKADVSMEMIAKGRELQIWPNEKRTADNQPIGRLILAPETEAAEAPAATPVK
jgi:hypothetical protein